jgi:hypothetical protein
MPLLSRRAASAAQGLGLNSSGKVHFSPVTYSTAGTYTFRVPIGNNSVKLTYPTITGMVDTTVTVTQNSDVTVIIGTYGVASSFGATSIPAYTKKVLDHTSGNVDSQVTQTFSVATTSVATVTTTNTGNSASTSNMNAAGIYFVTDSESSQGDFPETVTISTVPISTLVGTYKITPTLRAGGEPSFTTLAEPTSANSYRAQYQVGEGAYSNNAVSFSIALEQVGYIQISEVI